MTLSPTHKHFSLFYERNCKRAYLDQDVSKTTLKSIIKAASQAVSSKNTQPWFIDVVSGQTIRALSKDLISAFNEEKEVNPDYQYSPNPLPDTQMQRARECGYGLFSIKNINRKDYEARKIHHIENFRFFGAPQALILHTQDSAHKGTFLDCGAFLQSLLLATESIGLGACPQYSVASYPDIIRHHCNIPKTHSIICSISIGYPDPNAAVNQYKPSRISIERFCNFHD